MLTKSTTILIVEDNQFVRRALTVQLAGLGFNRVISVPDAEEALALLLHRQFELLIVDLELESINGLELIKRIRMGGTPQPAASRILVITAHRESVFLGTAVALDVNGFVVKGADKETLEKSISRALTTPVVIRPAVGYSVINCANSLFPEDGEKLAKHVYKPGVVVDEGGNRKRNSVVLYAEQLLPGMELAENIFSKDNKLVLAKGKALTVEHIAHLIKMRDRLDKPYIKVFPSRQ